MSVTGSGPALPTVEDTEAFGRALATNLRAGDLVILTGDLGAGKTALTRGIGAGLGVRGPITSPTFVIARVHPSVVDGPPLVHVDAYRLGGLTELDALDWAREAIDRGAGELLVNSIDADGTKDGFDLELVALMREISSVPVIASGGAGAARDFAPAIHAGADAVLAASVFHSGELSIGDVKDALASGGIEVRR